MKKLVYLLTAFFISCTNNSNQAEKLLAHFIDEHVEKIRDINYKLNLSAYDSHTGKKSFSELTDTFIGLQDTISHPEFLTPDYQALLQSIYHNENEFQFLKRFRDADLIQDPLLQRQLYSLYRNYFWTVNNFDELTRKQEILFDQFIQLQISKNNLDKTQINQYIEKHYALEKDFRSLLIQQNNDLNDLVNMNYYEYLLEKMEISDKHQVDLIERIEEVTRDDYKNLLSLMQEYLQKKTGKNKNELSYSDYHCCRMQFYFPHQWHKEYDKDELLAKLSNFYGNLNLSVDDILANSDIWYSKEKPSNIEFFICIDPEKDLRLFANLKPHSESIIVLLHEMAHAAHYKYVSPTVPYLVKEPNTILAEGIAMFFDSQLFCNQELRETFSLPELDDDPFFSQYRNPSLLYALRVLAWRADFERQMFINPNQDLTKLWWDLAEKYLLVKVKENERKPDWTFNRHIMLTGGMYQVYLNAVVLTAQLQYQMDANPQTMEELKSRLFQYGDTVNWQILFEQAFQQKFDPQYLPFSYKKKIDLIAFQQQTGA